MSLWRQYDAAIGLHAPLNLHPCTFNKKIFDINFQCCLLKHFDYRPPLTMAMPGEKRTFANRGVGFQGQYVGGLQQWKLSHGPRTRHRRERVIRWPLAVENVTWCHVAVSLRVSCWQWSLISAFHQPARKVLRHPIRQSAKRSTHITASAVTRKFVDEVGATNGWNEIQRQ